MTDLGTELFSVSFSQRSKSFLGQWLSKGWSRMFFLSCLGTNWLKALLFLCKGKSDIAELCPWLNYFPFLLYKERCHTQVFVFSGDQFGRAVSKINAYVAFTRLQEAFYIINLLRYQWIRNDLYSACHALQALNIQRVKKSMMLILILSASSQSQPSIKLLSCKRDYCVLQRCDNVHACLIFW